MDLQQGPSRDESLEERGEDGSKNPDNEYHFWYEFFHYYDPTCALQKEYVSQWSSKGPISWRFVLNRPGQTNELYAISDADSPNVQYLKMLEFVPHEIGELEFFETYNETKERMKKLQLMLELATRIAGEKQGDAYRHSTDDPDNRTTIMALWMDICLAIQKEVVNWKNVIDDEERSQRFTKNILRLVTVSLVITYFLYRRYRG